MPALHHVAVRKLIRSMQEDLSPRDFRVEVEHRGSILKLITKLDRAHALVKRGSSTEAATQVLIWQPSVNHQIGGCGGRRDLHATRQVFPEVGCVGKRGISRGGVIEALQQRPHVAHVMCGSKQEVDRNLTVWRDLDPHLKSGGIIPAPFLIILQVAVDLERSRARRSSITQKLLAAHGVKAFATGATRGCKHDRVAELVARPVARQKAPAAPIPLHGCEMVPRERIAAKDEFSESEYRHRSPPIGLVRNSNPRKFYRLIAMDGLPHMLPEATEAGFESRIAGAVINMVGCRSRRRAGRWRPVPALVLIPDIDRL